MSTTLYLTDYPAWNGASGNKYLSWVRGSGSVNKITTAVPFGTNIQVTDTAGGAALSWYSDQLNRVSISGSVTVNIRGSESATSVNVGAGILIQEVDSSGIVVGDIVAETTVPLAITEYGTTDAAKNASFTPTATVVNSKNRIKITLKVRNVVSMGSGTVTNSINGLSAGAAGDTWIQFSEKLEPLNFNSSPGGYAGPSSPGIAGWW